MKTVRLDQLSGKIKIFTLTGLAVLIVSARSASITAPELVSQIDSLLALPELARAQVGLAIYSLEDSQYLYHKNLQNLFVPASNMKLVTTAAGLHYLGKDFRFKTEFYHTGNISGGTLTGDLVIKGYGDPTVSNRFGGKVTGVLEEWCDSLQHYGIRKISGGLTADASYFDTVFWGPGWSLDDLSYWYAAEVSALNFNDNCVNLHFRAGSGVGKPVKIEFEPETDYIKWDNQSVTITGESHNSVDYVRPPEQNFVTFFGSYSVGNRKVLEDYVSVHQPPQFCLSVFRDVMERKYIETVWPDSVASDSTRRLLFTWHSHPLEEIVSVINKNSQNLYAECLFKTLGRIKRGEGSFRSGSKVLEEFLLSAGIPAGQFKILDGSGLSYMNLLSPQAVIQLLSHVHRQPYFDAYFETLARPGKDKSMQYRMGNAKNRNKMHLKTGFISNAICLSGYIEGENDRLYAISIMFNNYTADKEKLWEIQDKICELIAGLDRR